MNAKPTPNLYDRALATDTVFDDVDLARQAALFLNRSIADPVAMLSMRCLAGELATDLANNQAGEVSDDTVALVEAQLLAALITASASRRPRNL